MTSCARQMPLLSYHTMPAEDGILPGVSCPHPMTHIVTGSSLAEWQGWWPPNRLPETQKVSQAHSNQPTPTGHLLHA